MSESEMVQRAAYAAGITEEQVRLAIEAMREPTRQCLCRAETSSPTTEREMVECAASGSATCQPETAGAS
jgi:hypothetical protein